MKNKRYKVAPYVTGKKCLTYWVIDTFTGKRVSEKDCQLWAERVACELNKRWEDLKGDCKNKT